jgi:uncharacterized protein YbaP (TraB family)
MKLNKYKTLLWELLPESGGKSSYLFGTIHLPDQQLFFRIQEVSSLIDDCSLFLAEYPLNQPVYNDQEPFILPDNKSWLDYLTPKQYLKVGHQFSKVFGIDINNFLRIKPMLIEQVLAESMVLQHTGQPMDMILWNYASAKEIRMGGAETLESQLEIMKRFSLDHQFRSLIKIASNPQKYRNQVNQLKQYYLQENIRGLYKTSIRSLGKFRHMLVYNRNFSIARAIKDHIPDNKLFCAVGAGHLYGEKGLLRILKGMGIKPVPLRHIAE